MNLIRFRNNICPYFLAFSGLQALIHEQETGKLTLHSAAPHMYSVKFLVSCSSTRACKS